MSGSEDDNRKVECNDCGAELPSNWKERQPCPECGSIFLKINLQFEDHVKIRELFEGKVKDSKSKKPIKEFKQGTEPQRGRPGKWACVYRNIDREHDTYDEKVVDEETKQVLHECHERLSDHRGHGSAKKRKGGEGK